MTQTDAALVDELASEIQSRVLSGAIPTGARLRQESLAVPHAVGEIEHAEAAEVPGRAPTLARH